MGGMMKVGGISGDITLNANPAVQAMRMAKAEALKFQQAGKEAGNIWTKAMEDAKREIVGYDAALRAGRKGVEDLQAGVEGLSNKRLEVTKRIGEFHGYIDKSRAAVVDLKAKMDMLDDTRGGVAGIYKQLDKEIATSRKNVDALTAQLQAQRTMLANPVAGQDSTALRNAIKLTTQELNAMKRALSFQETNRNTAAQALRNIDREAKTAAASVKKLDAAMDFDAAQIERAEHEILQIDKRLDDSVVAAKRLKAELHEIAGMRTNAVVGQPSREKSAFAAVGAIAKADLLSYGMGFVAVGAAAEAMRRTAVASVAAVIQASMDLEVAQVEMAKTVDGTDAELAAMTEKIVAISLRTPFAANELLRNAGLGAQLGIQKENLVEFAEVMQQIQITTDLTAEEAATGFAQWGNITGLTQEKIKNLANVLVDLGQSSAATEKGILGMGLRLASAGAMAGMADEEIMALASSLKSVGLEDEAGGTAFSKIIIDMSKAVSSGGEQLDLFAQVSGKSAEKFADDWKSAPTAALLGFLDGLKKFKAAGGDLFGLAETLGFEDVRVGDALRRATLAADLFSQGLGRVKKSMAETAAIESETERFSSTLTAEIARLNNSFENLKATVGGIADSELKSFVGMASAAIQVVTWLEKETGFVEKGLSTLFQMAGGGAIVATLQLKEVASEFLALDEAERQFGDVAERNARMFEEMTIIRADMAREATEQAEAQKQQSVNAAEAEAAGFNRLRDAIKGGGEEVKKLAEAGEDLWRKLRPEEGIFENATRGLEQLKAAGKLNETSANLLGQSLWKQIGELSTENVELAIAKLHELKAEATAVVAGIQQAVMESFADELDKAQAEARGRRHERDQKMAEMQRRDMEEKAKEAQRITEQAQQDFNSLIDTIDPLGAAMTSLHADLELLGDFGVLGIEDNIVGVAKKFAEEWGKKIPESIQYAISSFESGEWEMNQSGIAAMKLVDALYQLKYAQEDLAAFDKKSSKPPGVDEGTKLYNNLHKEDASNVAKDIGRDFADLGENLNKGDTGSLLAKEYWKSLSTEARREIALILRELKKIPESSQVGGQQFAEEMEQLSQSEKKALKVENINSYADGIAGLGSQVGSLSPKFKNVATAAQGVSAVMHLATAAMSGDILGVISSVVALADAFGIFGEEQVKEVEGMDKVWKDFGDTVENQLDDLSKKMVENEQDFREFVLNLAKDLEAMMIKELVLMPIYKFGKDMLFNADGNAFDGGNVVPFAKGGVVSAPTMFPMAGGRSGIMGEAGPEAVVPLERMPGGKLGVNASAGGGGTQIVQVIDQRAAGSPPVEIEESSGLDGERVVRLIVRDVLHNEINGGGLDGPFGRNYGLYRRGA